MFDKLPVSILSKKEIAKDTFEVIFALNGQKFDFKAGQYIQVTIPKLLYPDLRGGSRDFSIASSPNQKDSLTIAFRQTGSGYKKSLVEGKDLEVLITGPQSKFSLPEDQTKLVVFIAGGIGITPFMSIIRFETEEKSNRKIILLYSNSSKEKAAYLNELENLEKENPNFTLKTVFKHIDADFIKQNIADIRNYFSVVAGPPAMVLSVKQILLSLGVSENLVNTEGFTGYDEPKTINSLQENKDDLTLIKLDGLLGALEKLAIVSITNLQGNITYANKKFQEVSKYSKEELIGQNHRILKSGFHSQEFYKELWDTIIAGKVWRGEIKNKAKDGTYYWVDSSICPLIDENGKIIGYAAVRFPITDKKEKEKNLEDQTKAMVNLFEDTKVLENQARMHSEELQKFQLAVKNAYEHIIITDETGKIIYANNAIKTTTGYEKEEVIGKTPSLWSSKTMSSEFYKKLWDTIATVKTTFVGEVTNKKKTGEQYIAEINISPILDGQKNIKYFVGLERDITKEKTFTQQLEKEKSNVEKKVEERTKELKEERERLFKFLESIPEGIYVLDANGKPYYANSQAKRLLGKGIIDASTSGLAEVYKAYVADTNTLYKSENIPIVQALSGRTTTVRDIEIKREDKTVPLEVSGAPIIDSSGKIIFAIAAFKDITEEKILERSRNEFFSIASHELRTPLTAIRGNTALIKQYYQDQLKDKDLKEMIDDIHASSIRLIEIVNDFLNTSRLEQGRMEFKKEAFNLSEVIENSLKDVGNLALNKNIYIKFDKPVDLLPDVFADKDKVKEIIINLVGNAIKFTQKGGVTVGIKQEDGLLKVSVMDTGKGIDFKQQNLLFRKFQQAEVDTLTRDSTQGTGLGLYISKLMIEQMGGKISLEKSSRGEGSVFAFTVPLAKII